MSYNGVTYSVAGCHSLHTKGAGVLPPECPPPHLGAGNYFTAWGAVAQRLEYRTVDREDFSFTPHCQCLSEERVKAVGPV